MAYRLVINSAVAAANRAVSMDVEAQSNASGSWVTIPNGSRTFLLSASKSLAITEGSGTDAEKRAALIELLKKDVIAWGLVQSDNALTQMTSLIPGGFPVTLDL